jgi:hypothetical protein
MCNRGKPVVNSRLGKVEVEIGTHELARATIRFCMLPNGGSAMPAFLGDAEGSACLCCNFSLLGSDVAEPPPKIYLGRCE